MFTLRYVILGYLDCPRRNYDECSGVARGVDDGGGPPRAAKLTLYLKTKT